MDKTYYMPDKNGEIYQVHIHAGINENKKEELSANEIEANILQKIKSHLDAKPKEFKIFSHYNNFTVLQYRNKDIVRVKKTPEESWIAIKLSESDKINEANNPLFIRKDEYFHYADLDNINELYGFINSKIVSIKKGE